MKKLLLIIFVASTLVACSTPKNNNSQSVNNNHNTWNYTMNITYPSWYSSLWKKALFYTWTCQSNSITEISKIATDLSGYNDLNDIKTQNILINWKKYLKFVLSDAWAGHSYDTYYYSTILNNNECFIAEFKTDRLRCENYLPLEKWNTKQETSYNKCVSSNNNFPNIMNSLEKSLKFWNNK